MAGEKTGDMGENDVDCSMEVELDERDQGPSIADVLQVCTFIT